MEDPLRQARSPDRGKEGKTTITFEEKAVPDFALFVSGRLDALYEEFREHDTEGDNP